MNYISWKGIDSRTVEGLIIQELPPIIKPQLRIQETTIDGVDGSIIEELGYQPYDRPMTIGLTRRADIDEVMAYFNGMGEAVFSNEPDKLYTAAIFDQIDYERLLRFREATINFHTQPFKYSVREKPLLFDFATDTMPVTVVNGGNVLSKPVITLRGTGRILFSLNGNQVFEYEFDEDQEVIINSEKEDAYSAGQLKNRYMTGNFPIFQIGNNEILIEGSVTKMIIERRSRWL